MVSTRSTTFTQLHKGIHSSGVNVFLVSASVEGASHAYSGWQKPIAYIWENSFGGLYSGLNISYSFVIIAMRSLLEKVSACGFSYW